MSRENPCPCSGERVVVEKIGTVDDAVRRAILRAPKERTVDEILKEIKVDFEVHVKRWNPDTERYMTEVELRDKFAELRTKRELAEWEKILLRWEFAQQELSSRINTEILHFRSEELCLDDLLTNGGRDLIHNTAFMTGAQPAALTQYAICNPATFSPAPTDTTLASEITTPSGLARHVCSGSVDGVTESFTHVAGTNTTVVVCGFKNNGGSAVTGIKGYGNFNAAGPPPAGTLGTESSYGTLDLNPNDIEKLTVTLTLG